MNPHRKTTGQPAIARAWGGEKTERGDEKMDEISIQNFIHELEACRVYLEDISALVDDHLGFTPEEAHDGAIYAAVLKERLAALLRCVKR
jgi:hypothetical protein